MSDDDIEIVEDWVVGITILPADWIPNDEVNDKLLAAADTLLDLDLDE